MKTLKSILFVSIALFTFAAILVSCQNKDAETLTATLSTNEFMRLVQDNVYPVNQLSDASVLHFNSSLVLNEQGEILSGDYSKIMTELTEEEFQLFFDLMFGQEVEFTDGDIPEAMAGDIASRSCKLIVFMHKRNIGGFTGNDGICTSQPYNFCTVCIPIQQ